MKSIGQVEQTAHVCDCDVFFRLASTAAILPLEGIYRTGASVKGTGVLD